MRLNICVDNWASLPVDTVVALHNCFQQLEFILSDMVEKPEIYIVHFAARISWIGTIQKYMEALRFGPSLHHMMAEGGSYLSRLDGDFTVILTDGYVHLGSMTKNVCLLGPTEKNIATMSRMIKLALKEYYGEKASRIN